MNDNEKKDPKLVGYSEEGRRKVFVYKDEDGTTTRVRVKGSPNSLVICGIIFIGIGLYGISNYVYNYLKNGNEIGFEFFIGLFMLLLFVSIGVFLIIFSAILKKKAKKYKPIIDELNSKDGITDNADNNSNDEFKIDEDKFKIDKNDF